MNVSELKQKDLKAYVNNECLGNGKKPQKISENYLIIHKLKPNLTLDRGQLQNKNVHCMTSGLVKEEYVVIILGYFFLFLHGNICWGYSLEVPHRGTSNEYPQRMFLWRTGENYTKIITNYSSLTSPLDMIFKNSLSP